MITSRPTGRSLRPRPEGQGGLKSHNESGLMSSFLTAGMAPSAHPLISAEGPCEQCCYSLWLNELHVINCRGASTAATLPAAPLALPPQSLPSSHDSQDNRAYAAASHERGGKCIWTFMHLPVKNCCKSRLGSFWELHLHSTVPRAGASSAHSGRDDTRSGNYRNRCHQDSRAAEEVKPRRNPSSRSGSGWEQRVGRFNSLLSSLRRLYPGLTTEEGVWGTRSNTGLWPKAI